MKKSLSLAALLSVFLIACGANKSTRSDLGSRGPTPTGPTPIPTNYKLAECSKVDASTIPLSGQLSTYYDPMTGIVRSDYIQMNLTSVPDGIKTGSTMYLQVFRWTDGATGFQINTLPTRMYFVNKITGQAISTNSVDQISKSVIEGLLSAAKITNITVNNFFEYHYVILTGMEMKWKAITIAYYNSALGVNAISSGDALLPPFIADPNIYALSNTARVQVLHPNYAYRTSGASENEFKNLTDEICRQFFSTVRFPASTEEESFFGKVTATLATWWEKLKSIF